MRNDHNICNFLKVNLIVKFDKGKDGAEVKRHSRNKQYCEENRAKVGLLKFV